MSSLSARTTFGTSPSVSSWASASASGTPAKSGKVASGSPSETNIVSVEPSERSAPASGSVPRTVPAGEPSLRWAVTTTFHLNGASTFNASACCIPATSGTTWEVVKSVWNASTPATVTAINTPIIHTVRWRFTSVGVATTRGWEPVSSAIVTPDGVDTMVTGFSTLNSSSTTGRCSSPVRSCSRCSITSSNRLACNVSIGSGNGNLLAIAASA